MVTMKRRISLSQAALIACGCLLIGFGGIWMIHASKHKGDAILHREQGPEKVDAVEYKAYSYTRGGILVAVGIVFLQFGLRNKKSATDSSSAS